MTAGEDRSLWDRQPQPAELAPGVPGDQNRGDWHIPAGREQAYRDALRKRDRLRKGGRDGDE